MLKMSVIPPTRAADQILHASRVQDFDHQVELEGQRSNFSEVLGGYVEEDLERLHELVNEEI